MENISYEDFWAELMMSTDNGTVHELEVSELVAKLKGNFRVVPRAIANVLAVVILTTNSGSLLAVSCRDRSQN